MGRDKALLLVDGRPMAERVAAAARAAGAVEVVAVGGDAGALEALGLRYVPDLVPGAGPLPAVVAALGVVPGDAVLVLGCDLVAPSPGAMAEVVGALLADPGADVAVPVDDGGRRQWVHAAWRPRARGALAAAHRAGVRALHRAVADLAVLDVPQLPADALRDADVPGDLPEGR